MAVGARLLDRGMASFPDLQLSPGQSPDAWVPILVAAAGLCVAGLTLRRSPWLARFAAAAAAGLGAVDIIGQVRAQLASLTDPSAWPPLVGVSVAAALIALGVTTILAASAATAMRPSRFGASARAAVTGAFVVVAFAQGAMFLDLLDAVGSGRPWDPATEIRLPNRVLLAGLTIDLACAVLVVAGPRIRRAWVRSRVPPATTMSPATGGDGLLQALADEFVPGLSARSHAAAAAERERLAAELHARIVPELRRAIAGSAPGSTGVGPAADLRGALDDVEALMAERHSVILEEFGLVAALEWVAERATARTGTTVELDIGELDESARPPRDVERAAFRVALLAVDNATRHAPAVPVTMAVHLASGAVRLAITDSGPGLDPPAVDAARRAGHRGLRDMEATARLVGGTLSLGSGTDGRGTRVAFDWPGR